MIVSIKLREPVLLDQNRLVEIVARLGAARADEMISRTMEDLAVHLATIENATARRRSHLVKSTAQEIRNVAARVGMPGLSSVAHDVSKLANGNDHVALAATVARLARCGEASLMKVWDLQGLSV